MFRHACARGVVGVFCFYFPLQTIVFRGSGRPSSPAGRRYYPLLAVIEILFCSPQMYCCCRIYFRSQPTTNGGKITVPGRTLWLAWLNLVRTGRLLMLDDTVGGKMKENKKTNTVSERKPTQQTYANVTTNRGKLEEGNMHQESAQRTMSTLN